MISVISVIDNALPEIGELGIIGQSGFYGYGISSKSNGPEYLPQRLAFFSLYFIFIWPYQSSCYRNTGTRVGDTVSVMHQSIAIISILPRYQYRNNQY